MCSCLVSDLRSARAGWAAQARAGDRTCLSTGERWSPRLSARLRVPEERAPAAPWDVPRGHEALLLAELSSGGGWVAPQTWSSFERRRSILRAAAGLRFHRWVSLLCSAALPALLPPALPPRGPFHTGRVFKGPCKQQLLCGLLVFLVVFTMSWKLISFWLPLDYLLPTSQCRMSS